MTRQAITLWTLTGLFLLTGCATTRGSQSTDYGPAMARAMKNCGRLRETKGTLHTPIQTDIDGRMKRIERAGKAGKGSDAFTQADELANECSGEVQMRKQVASLVSDIEKDKGRYPPNVVSHFYRLVSNGDYTRALRCGDAMMQGTNERCLAIAPSSKEEQRRPGESTGPEMDLDEDSGSTDVRSGARQNRLMLSLGIGVGTASMGGVHDSADDVRLAFAASNGGLTLDGAPKSGTQINWGAEVRYYAPYNLMVQLGFDTIYNKASTEFDGGTLENQNWGLELPLLVGAYYMASDTLCVHGALGPTFLVWSRSLWSSDPGGAPDYRSDPAVGAHFMGGLDYIFNDQWALGLDLRYRLLRAGNLIDVQTGDELRSGELRGDQGRRTYEMDLSGFSAAFFMRVFIM